MASANPSSFPHFKNNIIKLSSKLSNNLAILSNSTTSETATTISTSIESQIAQLSESINDAQKLFPAKQGQINRFKNELSKHQTDFRNLSTKLTNKFQKSQLFSTISGSDNDNLHSQSHFDTDDYFLDERNRIESTHSTLDNWINQALITRDEIFRQNSTLSNVSNSIDNTLQKIPGLNSLLGRIQDKRKRNAFILASIILIAVIILWLSL